MSSVAYIPPKLTPAEYLAREASSLTKHEFVDGVVYAMAGGTGRHARVATVLANTLFNHLPESCEVVPFVMKVRINAGHSELFYYPDVIVTCGQVDLTLDYREEPILLIEVLSPSTERTDRKEKFEAYKNIRSLQEYIIAHQDIPTIEVYRRRTVWQQEVFLPGTRFMLDSVELELAVDDIYRRMNF